MSSETTNYKNFGNKFPMSISHPTTIHFQNVTVTFSAWIERLNVRVLFRKHRQSTYLVIFSAAKHRVIPLACTRLWYMDRCHRQGACKVSSATAAPDQLFSLDLPHFMPCNKNALPGAVRPWKRFWTELWCSYKGDEDCLEATAFRVIHLLNSINAETIRVLKTIWGCDTIPFLSVQPPDDSEYSR